MKICKVKICDEPVGKHGARGWCIKHYMRWKKFGNPLHAVKSQITVDRSKICKIDECEVNIHNTRGWCYSHYMRWWRYGDPEPVVVRKGYGHPMYKMWISMKQRCDNSNLPAYERYGARGITYEPRWSVFLNFLEDMGERPDGMTIERIDNNGNYTKENCRWATPKEQQNNTRRNVNITYDGQTMNQAQWEIKLKMPTNTIYNRLKAGWSVEEAITKPLRKNINRRPAHV